MNGQTLGKKIMKIQIVSSENKKLSMNNYLIRSLLVDSILMNIISIITILLMNKTLKKVSNTSNSLISDF